MCQIVWTDYRHLKQIALRPINHNIVIDKTVSKGIMSLPFLSVNDMRLKKIVICFLLGLGVTACSSYRPVPQAFHEVINQAYVLDAGDKVRVTVFQQADLTNTFGIDSSGYIAFPLIGALAARGKTVQQLEADIAKGLRKGFIRNPDVTVEVDRYRPVFVLGEVNGPGQYTYVPGMTVQKAIATAGGYSARASQENADVTRQVNGEIITGRVPISDPILPGDTVYIRERVF